ncbi:transcription cofactor HES-6-like [Sander vitreus]
MAPSARPSSTGLDMEEDESYYGIHKADRKTRKPLVEKKRRARINESLQELRTLLADTDFHSKMENAEVLEITVKKVEDVLKNRTQETDTLNQEASERFAAGYIQCMHEVHMFVSSCPGIDSTVAAELLNHLLECMPLNEDHLQDVLMDLITDTSGSNSSTWHGGDEGEALCTTLASPGGRSLSSSSSSALSPALSPAPSTTSSEDLCSDLDETDSEHNQSSTEGLENREGLSMPTMTYPQSMWRPW